MAWTKKGHSPSSHPRHRITVRSSQRSVLLTKTFAIVLFRRIHFLSVKTSHYFQVISEPLNLPSGQPGQFEQGYEFGARDSNRNRNRNSDTPSSQIGGEAPDVYIFQQRAIWRRAGIIFGNRRSERGRIRRHTNQVNTGRRNISNQATRTAS